MSLFMRFAKLFRFRSEVSCKNQDFELVHHHHSFVVCTYLLKLHLTITNLCPRFAVWWLLCVKGQKSAETSSIPTVMRVSKHTIPCQDKAELRQLQRVVTKVRRPLRVSKSCGLFYQLSTAECTLSQWLGRWNLIPLF